MKPETGPETEIGLMGGMFDPVHYGHLQVVRSARSFLEIPVFFLLPCGSPVHKEGVFANDYHRIAMLELAVEIDSNLRVDDRECRKQEPSFTVNTLKEFRQEYPDSRLYYLMGQDAFNGFHTWHQWREIFDYAHIVIAARPGYEPVFVQELQKEYDARVVENVAELRQCLSGKILPATLELLEISSSGVRNRLLGDEPIEGMVPDKVVEYIRKHNLYDQEKTV